MTLKNVQLQSSYRRPDNFPDIGDHGHLNEVGQRGGMSGPSVEERRVRGGKLV